MATQLSNQNQITQGKLKSFLRSKSPNIHVSRSFNPTYNEVSKLDDVTRYNSSAHNVNFYQDYPNRQGTPIRPQRRNQSVSYRKPVPEKVKFLNSLFTDSNLKSKLFSTAAKANLRTSNNLRIVKHTAGNNKFVMNDYHNRETNAGFARNEAGGFYTR